MAGHDGLRLERVDYWEIHASFGAQAGETMATFACPPDWMVYCAGF
jgi:hypothetical protein